MVAPYRTQQWPLGEQSALTFVMQQHCIELVSWMNHQCLSVCVFKCLSDTDLEIL